MVGIPLDFNNISELSKVRLYNIMNIIVKPYAKWRAPNRRLFGTTVI